MLKATQRSLTCGICPDCRSRCICCRAGVHFLLPCVSLSIHLGFGILSSLDVHSTKACKSSTCIRSGSQGMPTIQPQTTSCMHGLCCPTFCCLHGLPLVHAAIVGEGGLHPAECCFKSYLDQSALCELMRAARFSYPNFRCHINTLASERCTAMDSASFERVRILSGHLLLESRAATEAGIAPQVLSCPLMLWPTAMVGSIYFKHFCCCRTALPHMHHSSHAVPHRQPLPGLPLSLHTRCSSSATSSHGALCYRALLCSIASHHGAGPTFH